MDKKLLEKLINDGMFYLFIGSLISSDNLNNSNDYKESIKRLNETKEILSDFECENKEKYLEMVEKGLNILEKEYKELSF